MKLIVSHFTKNKGTTDFYLDYLQRRKEPYYYLRHPFFSSAEQYSELLYFDGKSQKTVQRWPKSKSELFDMARNFATSIQASFIVGTSADQVFGFGSFNIAPFLITHLFFSKRRTFFWGCDYSRQRFSNSLLNLIYLTFETISCKYSGTTINATIRQQEARIHYHGLRKERSIISPNGIIYRGSNPVNNTGKRALFYLGSITNQHGIIEFVKRYYVEKTTEYKLYIIGGGEKENELASILRATKNSDVHFLGQLDQSAVLEKINSLPEQLMGIAPYDSSINDHVYYGDSLKIKEYLNYGIPYITSNVTYVQDDLTPFGFIYHSADELDKMISDLNTININFKGMHKVLAAYDWSAIFDTLTNRING